MPRWSMHSKARWAVRLAAIHLHTSVSQRVWLRPPRTNLDRHQQCVSRHSRGHDCWASRCSCRQEGVRRARNQRTVGKVVGHLSRWRADRFCTRRHCGLSGRRCARRSVSPNDQTSSGEFGRAGQRLAWYISALDGAPVRAIHSGSARRRQRRKRPQTLAERLLQAKRSVTRPRGRQGRLSHAAPSWSA